MNIIKFAKIRTKLGQEKYGAGTDNAGWWRDNGRDVIEELHDAIVISGYWWRRALIFRVWLAPLIWANCLLLWIQMYYVNFVRWLCPDFMVNEPKETKRFPPREEVE